MNRLTFSNIVALLAVGALIVIYFRSKKDTEQALKAVTPQPSTTGTTQPSPGSRTVEGGGSVLPVVYTNGATLGGGVSKYTNGANYGNVGAGDNTTPINNTPTGGGATASGGTSYNPGTF